MEREKSNQASLLMWALVAAFLSQNLLISVMSTASVEDQKTYYSPDPHAGSHHRGSHRSPPHGSGGSYGGTPPIHGTPSHGGSGSYGSSPPANCENPPSGGHYDPTPSTPTTPSIPSITPPTIISPPTITPPVTISPPTTPIDPGTPSTPGGGYYNSPPTSGGSTPTAPSIPSITPPTTPIYPVTPSSPGTPTIPGISTPSPPFDPNSPFTGTCNFWSTNPGLIWGLFGWAGTLGGAFGTPSLPGTGASMSLQEALSNSNTDGLGALYREGTASLLNSMVNRRFPYTTTQVRDSFVRALGSNKAAAAQAHLFKLANEGRLKPRA
ncbi:unnamed protein product [Ilex paraguariensis]|uniref:Protodermal factor 1 n=1 Tax=Ilex paraguariensis TaxID=185542 RepID=A0ABC8SZS7_9AQUA